MAEEAVILSRATFDQVRQLLAGRPDAIAPVFGGADQTHVAVKCGDLADADLRVYEGTIVGKAGPADPWQDLGTDRVRVQDANGRSLSPGFVYVGCAPAGPADVVGTPLYEANDWSAYPYGTDGGPDGELAAVTWTSLVAVSVGGCDFTFQRRRYTLVGPRLVLFSEALDPTTVGLPVSEVTIYEPDGTGTVTMTDCTNGTVTIGRTARTVCQVNCCV